MDRSWCISLLNRASDPFPFFPFPSRFSSRCVRIRRKISTGELGPSSSDSFVFPLLCCYAKEAKRDGSERGTSARCNALPILRSGRFETKKTVCEKEGERERGREGEDNERARARLLECVGRLEGIASERVTVTLKRNAKLGGE